MLALTYHSISAGPAPLCISPERFADQLDALTGLGWNAISLAALEDRLTSQPEPDEVGDECERVFAITFDDGYRDFYTSALPILEARNLPVTLFALPPVGVADRSVKGHSRVPGGTDAPVLSASELRAVARCGVEIGAHSIHHGDLTRLDDLRLTQELETCQRTLEHETDSRVQRFAYPFGRYTRRVCDVAAKTFRTAYTTQLAPIDRRVDSLAIPRVDAFYLDSPGLRRALADGRPERFLTPRRWLRRLRGSEPWRRLPYRFSLDLGAPAESAELASHSPLHHRSSPAHVRS